MARADAIILLRRLLKRMEQEEWTLDENLGYDPILTEHSYSKHELNGLDSYTLNFRGPKQKTSIPDVLVVWPDGYSERKPYREVRGIQRNGERPIYKYCPIKLSDIKPINHQKAVIECFRTSDIYHKG